MRVFAMLALIAASVKAADPSPTNNAAELELALKKLRVAPGLRAELFAAEPLIQNPVSFTFDERGQAYVVETHRRRTSVFDIRNHPDWLDDDFGFRTVADRSNFFRKVLVPGNTNIPAKLMQDRNGDGQFDWRDLEVESERIRLVTDGNGDGRADEAKTYADGFNTLVSGVAAGVLTRKGDVYFTCIPNLWLLRDTNGDGVADERKSLAQGFGVHISFGGHDLHGLKIGPDGKLYFSIADRGAAVESNGQVISVPDTGSIFRCNLDGSELELFASGFRNPQELAFDQYGNLWTGDNNGDGGDRARWLMVVEGGEYGWHYGWQHLPKMGAWNAEGLWEMGMTNTATYLLPPTAHVGHGPAGVAFYPGTGLPAQYRDHFFMADFPGGVRTFKLQSRGGVGYQVVDLRQLVWEMYPVDVDFGPRGGLYVLDWVQGWEKTGKGRLFRIFDEKLNDDPGVVQTRQYLSEGLEKRSTAELGTLLAHIDLRVRQEAQFVLASRGPQATNELAQIALNSPRDLARLHAIWALGQIARSDVMVYPLLYPILEDQSFAEARAQAARVLGDGSFALNFPALARAAADPNPRVRFYGTIGLGKLETSDAADTILRVLRENGDADPYLRHAGVMALTWMNDMNVLEAAAKDSSSAVRLGALLAMRRLQRPEVAMFLYETRPQLILEAARAVYDLPLTNSLSQLAALISKTSIPKGAMRRALHANYRLGRLENAMALAEFVGNTSIIPELRADGIELLGRWGENTTRDLFLGLHRPLPARESRAAALSLRSELPKLLGTGPAEVRMAAVEAAVRLDLDGVGPSLLAIFARTNEPPQLRLMALKALAKFKDARLSEALRLAVNDSNAEIRKEASTLAVRAPGGDRTAAVLRMLESGAIPEKQSALELLGTMQGPPIDPAILMWLDRVSAGKAPKELELEILEAAAKRQDPLVRSTLQKYNERRANNPMANYSESLAGGDAEAGRKIFVERADVGCLRCHKVGGTGGEVGPDLTGIGARASREYILESIVAPNARMTKGYEDLIIRLHNGDSHIGLMKNEDAEYVYILSADEGLLKVPKESIDTLDLGLSSMPQEIPSLLTKRELRNLVEFLANEK